jgi:glycosyltransferase involved in cell wall biosynthesis
MLFSIITPTIGNPRLKQLLESINNQTYTNIEHIIVIDGSDYYEKVFEILEQVPVKEPIIRHIIPLPFSSGKNYYYGHKIYASIPQLLKSDYVVLLDDDNTFKTNHIQSYYELLEIDNYEWIYSLRNIEDDEGYICRDECESLGYLSPIFYNKTQYMIDTNCLCIRLDIMIENSYIWNRPGYNKLEDPDRVFSNKLMTEYPKYYCSQKYTVNYYVGNRPDSVKRELFLMGNKNIINRWDKEPIYIVHFNPKNTEKIIERVYQKDKSEIGFKQWQLNILDKMDEYCLISGYQKYIPSGSKVIFHICNIQELPLHLLERKDIIKILYTIESPNIRHQIQWMKEFLEKFDIVITYWKPLLELSNVLYFPFIYRLDYENQNDMKLLQTNKGVNKSVCIILEKRDFRDEYEINSIKMRAQDYLRYEYAKNIKEIDCYGDTWKPHNNVINYKLTKNRFLDQEKTIDIMVNYTFTLIIENCNGENYVSEKIYDAFVVGSIPLYYGNNSELIDIPKDMYIDLKKIKPKQIKEYLNNLTENEIEIYRKNIYEKREEVLRKVSVNEYNNMLKDIIN